MQKIYHTVRAAFTMEAAISNGATAMDMDLEGESVAMDICCTSDEGDQEEKKGQEDRGVDASLRETDILHLTRVCEKRLLQKGQGLSSPVPGASCKISLQIAGGTCECDAQSLGYPSGESSVQIGEGDTRLSSIIDIALLRMKRGEISELKIYRELGCEEYTLLHITLLDFSSATSYWRMTPTEKYATAVRHKERGTFLFREGHIEPAFARFSMATRLLLSAQPRYFSKDEDGEKSCQQLLCQCYLNLAACQMKTGCHNHVVTNCSHALELEPSNVKARYRRASALISLGDYSLAKEDLEKGLLQEPCNRVLNDLLQTVSAKLSQSNAYLAKGLSKMFA